MSTSSTLPMAESNWLPPFLRPPRPAMPLVDPQVIQSRYRHYRNQILIWTTIGYAMFYYVRKNLSVAQPEIESHLHILHTGMGLVLTLHGVVYGVSKFLNGMLAD